MVLNGDGAGNRTGEPIPYSRGCVPSLLKEPGWSSEVRVRTAGASAAGSGIAMQTTGVFSQGSPSDSSYAVSGTSSAGTARDRPKARSTKRTRIEEALLITDTLPTKFGDLRLRGCCVSTGGNCSSERRNDKSSTSLPLSLISAIEASPFGVMFRTRVGARGGSERLLAWFVGEICDYTN